MSSRASQIEFLELEPIWEQTRGQGVTVAVLDSGVWTSSALPEDRIETFAIGGGPQTPTSNSHGTNCASLIASAEDDAEGAAPEAKVLSIQLISSTGEVRAEDVARGLRFALDRGCDVISCSFVLPDMGSVRAELCDLSRRAHLNGVPLLVAAGNRPGLAADFPESVPHAIVVSACTAERRAMAVNFNRWTDAFALGEALDVVGDSAVTGQWQGETSGATALMSGVVALMLSTVPRAQRARIGIGVDGLIKLSGKALHGQAGGTALSVDAPALFAAVKSHVRAGGT
jgi:subtilisin family serine protease